MPSFGGALRRANFSNQPSTEGGLALGPAHGKHSMPCLGKRRHVFFSSGRCILLVFIFQWWQQWLEQFSIRLHTDRPKIEVHYQDVTSQITIFTRLPPKSEPSFKKNFGMISSLKYWVLGVEQPSEKCAGQQYVSENSLFQNIQFFGWVVSRCGRVGGEMAAGGVRVRALTPGFTLFVNCRGVLRLLMEEMNAMQPYVLKRPLHLLRSDLQAKLKSE